MFAALRKSAGGPHVWSGRASQEVFVDLSVVRSCINVSGLSLERVLRATMDISAPALSLAGRPQVGHLGYQCSQAPGRPSSISSHPLADLGGNRLCLLYHRWFPYLCSSFVRAMKPFLRPGLRLFQGTARRGRQGWPSRLAHLWLGTSRPRVDGPEHGATLTQIGTPSHLSSHIRICTPC
jgi:hypothetical protein